MEKLYKYQGTVSEIGFNGKGYKASANIVLHDINDWDKTPIRIEAFGGLAKYIDEIEGTDAAERYLKANWFYDRNLYLHRIEIPSNNEHIPAKVITQDNWLSDELVIFGPQDYIETDSPDPMDSEQASSWAEYKSGVRRTHKLSINSDRLLEKNGTAIIVGQIYTNHNGSDYLCKSITDDNSAEMERVTDGWTLVAHGLQKHEDGTIEWDYSTGGHWAKELDFKMFSQSDDVQNMELQEDESLNLTI